jgi:hypothetical protein
LRWGWIRALARLSLGRTNAIEQGLLDRFGRAARAPKRCDART